MGIMPLFLLENDKPVSCVVTVFLIFLNVMLCLYLFFFFLTLIIFVTLKKLTFSSSICCQS